MVFGRTPPLSHVGRRDPVEGSVVTVVAREDDEAFDVTPEEERALLAAIAQAERLRLSSHSGRRWSGPSWLEI